VDLPTYTSIWRIEKRLYKLYDFRLPMPLPVGQIAVFAGIAVPYVILLTLFGLPFNHTLFWLYVLPPGVLTWLATRPVLESKRLPELIISQMRYVGEPRTWCRLSPLAESDEIQVVARVWRRTGADAPALASQPAAAALRPLPEPAAAERAAAGPALERPALDRPGLKQPVLKQPVLKQPVLKQPVLEQPGAAPLPRRPARFPLPGPSPLPSQARPAAFAPPERHPARPERQPGAAERPPGAPERQLAGRPGAPSAPGVPVRAEGPDRVARRTAAAHAPAPPAPAAPAQPAASAPAAPAPAAPAPAAPAPAAGAPAVPAPAAPAAPSLTPGPGTGPVAGPAPLAGPEPAGAAGPAGAAEPAPPVPPAPRPVRIVSAGPAPARPARQVERALGGPADQRSTSWRDHVTVVPGGRGPGRPDTIKRDRARAAAALAGPRLVVVLGCTVGAGQTVTALILADLLARLRSEPVAAVDLNPGPASLAEQAQAPLAATVSTLLAGGEPARQSAGFGVRGRGRLDVIAQDAPAEGSRPVSDQDHRRLYDLLASRYPLTVTDPGAVAVARALVVADQLILVAPASPDAARATAMTQEWLDANGYGQLTAGSIAVLNGVSNRSVVHAEQAEAVLRGRCRAIVRIPWDDHLGEPSAERGIRECQAASGSRLDQLRPQVLDAYTALAGVLVSALTASPPRRRAVR
jgi:MinD-like ATPase involved in chromosome partitioning or flagellar assembly